MRRARRAALLVAFYLLTSAATACAECAWVLWQQTGITPTTPGKFDAEKMFHWEIRDGFKTHDDC